MISWNHRKVCLWFKKSRVDCTKQKAILTWMVKIYSDLYTSNFHFDFLLFLLIPSTFGVFFVSYLQALSLIYVECMKHKDLQSLSTYLYPLLAYLLCLLDDSVALIVHSVLQTNMVTQNIPNISVQRRALNCDTMSLLHNKSQEMDVICNSFWPSLLVYQQNLSVCTSFASQALFPVRPWGIDHQPAYQFSSFVLATLNPSSHVWADTLVTPNWNSLFPM